MLIDELRCIHWLFKGYYTIDSLYIQQYVCYIQFKTLDMKKISTNINSLIWALLVSILILNQGCALLVKNQINKKFPPVSSVEKKIQATCQNIKMTDTTKLYDALVSINKKLVDTIIVKTLKGDIKEIKFTDSRIDSLSIIDVADVFCLQELILKSDQIVNFNYKRLKNISYTVSAATSPYYSNDTIFINPFFNSVKIKSVKFKGLGFLTRRKIIYSLINGLINNHLDNINGKIKNYYFVINPVPEDEKKVSSLLTKNTGNISIEKDDTIKFEKKTPNIAFKIDSSSLQILLAVNKAIEDYNFICTETTGLSKKEKNELFCKLYDELRVKWGVIDEKHFDASSPDNNYFTRVKIRNGFLAENINYGFHDMDFRFSMNQDFAADVPRSGIYIPKPSINCPSWRRCLIIPQFCIACNAAKLVLRGLPSRIRVGSFGGNLDGRGSVSCKLGTINVNDNFLTITISKSLGFSGNLNYNFNYFGDGLGGIVLACPVLQFKGSPSVNGGITNPDLKVNIEKQNTDTNCIAKINFEPIKYQVQLNPPPIVETFLNIRNHLTCNMTLFATGFGLGRVVGALFHLEEPIRIMDATLSGKYNSEYQIKSISYPIIYNTKTKYGDIKLKSFWGHKSINASF